jgi:hypothetical protein
MSITWARRGGIGYEVSSLGDKRFSALYARLADGRSIEEWYQCEERSPNGYPLKGYDPGGTNWRRGKGKPPKDSGVSRHDLWLGYLDLWYCWARAHMVLIWELREHALDNGACLKDSYATTEINQAAALAEVINHYVDGRRW